MIRTHTLPCSLPRHEADALNAESGRLYSLTLLWHWRIYRRKGIWLSQSAAEKLGDFMSQTTLHAHSRDAAQQGFYRACTTIRTLKKQGDTDARYPSRRKRYRTTVWKNTGIRMKGGHLRLARAKGLPPVSIQLPPDLAHVPPAAFLEARLVYDKAGRRYHWHVVVEDAMSPKEATGDQTLAIDLGEIHPAAVANEHGEVVIFSARGLRSINQYRHKRLSTLQARQSKLTKRSRRWKRLQRRKVRLLARNQRQVRDIEHKVMRAVVNYAVEQQAGTVYVGDLRDVGDGKRLKRTAQQKVSGWSHGRQIQYLSYKLAAEGITLHEQSEAYTSQTCPHCGKRNKSEGRNYRCAGCGFRCHRDAVGASNFESLVLHGVFGHVVPVSIKYRHPFQRRRRSPDTGQVA